MAMDIDVYGYIGQEMMVENKENQDTFFKLHVIFAIVDAKKKRLAWYLFAQDEPQSGRFLFDQVVIGKRKLDQNEMFGEAISYPTLNSIAGSDIGRLAPRMSSIGAHAKLFLTTNKRDMTTTCKLSNLIDLDRNLVSLQFQLETFGEKKGADGIVRGLREIGKKKGHVWLITVEPFSQTALKRGIRGPSKLTNNKDPYSPVF